MTVKKGFVALHIDTVTTRIFSSQTPYDTLLEAENEKLVGTGIIKIGTFEIEYPSDIVKHGPFVKEPKCVICNTDLKHSWLDGDYSLLLCENENCWLTYKHEHYFSEEKQK